jgi:hypothetical protein
MSGNAAQLYEEDFVRWTEQQSRALPEAAGVGTNLPLDWENLAEEIESLGASQRRELRSRLGGTSDETRTLAGERSAHRLDGYHQLRPVEHRISTGG